MNRIQETAVMYGERGLSNAQVMALFLGISEEKATTLYRNIGGWDGLKSMSVAQLKALPGIGNANAIRLRALCEAHRRMGDKLSPGRQINGSRVVKDHFGWLTDEKQEMCFSLLLDSKMRVTKEILVSIGTLNLSIVHPRDVLRAAVVEAAYGFILVHNHPSGDPSPSDEDTSLTKRLALAGELFGIKLIDHVIIGNELYYSFAEHNALE